jgi:hypothetical protein
MAKPFICYHACSGVKWMSKTDDRSASSNQQEFRIPYPSSWMDSLKGRIQAIPGPSWLFYAVTLLGVAILNNVVFWIDGSLSPGSFLLARLIDSGYIVFPSALYHYLTSVAGRSVQAFRPILKAPGSDQDSLEYQMMNLPRRFGWLAIVLGCGIAVPGVLTDPASVGASAAITVLPIIYQSIALSITISSVLVVMFQTFRQLRLVVDLHRKASEINLFDIAPTHTFANLTARASLGLIGLVLFIALGGLVEQTGLDETQLIFITVMGILAVAMFFLPLLGMRNRLKDEKARLLRETHLKLQQTIGRVHDQVDSNQYETMSDLKEAMSALMEERNLIIGISTWPWDPGTFRGFATTILLPITLWLVTRLLERII